MRPLVRVVTGPEAAAHDAATIAAGVPSRALMQRAGAAAAAEITNRFSSLLSRGVLVLAGPGNNGGDGWVIARALAAAGVSVSILSPEPARSPDCIAERELAVRFIPQVDHYGGEGIVVDALLGTGSVGAPRGEVARASLLFGEGRSRGAAVVAIDLPSGLDATTGGYDGATRADLTITFGNIKRGHLVARGLCGTIVALDIGLSVIPGPSVVIPSPSPVIPSVARDLHLLGVNSARDLHLGVNSARDLHLVDASWVRGNVPTIAAEAHKGSRKKLLLHGGGPGMAGAAILALRAALASGIGMVKAGVHSSTVDAIHGAVPAAMIDPWSDATTPDEWPDVLVAGPGLGLGADRRAALERVIAGNRGAVLLDADALNLFAGDAAALRPLLGNRPVLLTPHILECARLLSVDSETVLDRRFEIGTELAEQTGAVVLLKGVPTIISAPDGRRLVVAEGTPTLAAGGSGDILSGIAGTLLAQMSDPFAAAACAAWIHGRAARLAGAFVRGTTLEEVLEMLPNAWRISEEAPRYPILAELPSIPAQ